MTIKPTELRIGNKVLIDGVENIIRGGAIAAIETGYFKQKLEPIPLTEKWLLKFGFDGLTYDDELINGVKISFEERHDGWAYQLGLEPDWLPAIGIDYVHQLQNLYFALTGKELCSN